MHGNVLVLSPRGSLDRSGSPALNELVRNEIETGVARIAFDFSLTESVSSYGLRTIFDTGNMLRARHGQIALSGLTPKTRPLFKASGLLLLFCDFPTLGEALVYLDALPQEARDS